MTRCATTGCGRIRRSTRSRPPAIVVDPGGRRLLDEGLGGISITNDLARLDDPLCATVICDAAIWDTAGRAAQIPPNPQLVEGGGTLHQAGTMEELAGLAGLDPATLRATVEAYNEAVRNGRLAELSPPRSAKSGAPRPIETPPFYAIPICAGITNTFGGIAIDGHGRVRRPDGSVIDGPVRGRRLHRRARRRRRARLCRRADQGLRPRPARRRGRRPAHPAGRGIAPMPPRRFRSRRGGARGSLASRIGFEGGIMPRVLVIHGAGMNMRGKVQTEIFGPMTLPRIRRAHSRLRARPRPRCRDLPLEYRGRDRQPAVRGQ